MNVTSNISMRQAISAFFAVLMVTSLFAASVGTVSAATADDLVWEGQEVQYSGNTSESYVLRNANDDSFVRELTTDSNGVITIDTSSGEGEGTYYIERESDNTNVYTYEVVKQDVSSSVNNAEVSNDYEDTKTTFTFDSNRGTYDLIISSESLETQKVADLFGNNSDVTVEQDADGNDIVVLNNVDDSTEFQANFDGYTAGDYTFQFTPRDAEGSASSTVTVNDAGSQNVQLSDNYYSVSQGAEATFEFTLTETNTFNFVIGDEQEAGYEIDMTVEDTNDDGKATVNFNTLNAGQSGTVVEGGEGTTVTVNSETNLSDMLDVANYPIEAGVNGQTTTVATFDVLEHEEYTGDGVYPVYSNFNGDFEELQTYLDENYDGGQQTVAQGDQFVVSFDVSGQVGLLDGATAADLAKGSTFAQNNGMYVSVEEVEAGMNSEENTLDVSQATLHVDEEEERAYFVFDTSDYNLENENAYEATLTLDKNNPFVDLEQDETVEVNGGTFEQVEGTLGLSTEQTSENEDFAVFADSEQSFTLDSTYAPGTEATVRVQSDEVSGPSYLYTESVTIGEDEEATFDFSETTVGDTFTVKVTGTQNTEEFTGEVVEMPAYVQDVEVSSGAENVETGSEVTFTADVTTADRDGSYEVAWDFNGDGETEATGLQSSTTFDSAGEHEVTVTVTGEDGSEVTKTLTVTVTEPTPSETEEPTPTETTEETSTTEEEVETTSESETPGFGAIVGLVALVAAALLAYRRD